MKCAQTPGSSCSSASGALEANVFHAGAKLSVAVIVLDDHLRVEQPRGVEAVVAARVGARLARRRAPNGIGCQTMGGRRPRAPPRRAPALASTARACRRGGGRASGPAGSSTTNALVPGNVWFCQPVAVPW